MEVVEIDGVGYVKASEAAKRAKYTADYVGQLCRGEKIPAKLIGRTWYVDLDGLLEYKAEKHGEIANEAPAEPRRSPARRIDNHRVAKTRQSEKSNDSNTQNRISYERDFEPVNLDLDQKPQKSRSVKVELHNPKRLRIHLGSAKKTNFEASEMPSVSLSGKLSVEEYEENVVDEATDETDTVVRPAKSLHQKSHGRSTRPAGKQREVMETTPAQDDAVSVAVDSAEETAPVASFRPQSVPDGTPTSPLLRFAPAIATIVALVCVGLILSAHTSVIVDGGQSVSSVTLQAANFLQLFD